MYIQPINNHILIEPLVHESFISLDKGVYEEVGIVIETGDVCVLKKGDKVFFDSWLSSKYPKNDKEFFWLVKYDDIRAVEKN